jgi:glycosyltransferase involved in cell wall biosynthesis
VWRVYRRAADVIYPPVDVERFVALSPREDYYITVSRLVPYKRVDLLVRAFSQLGRRLVVVGDGPEMSRLKTIAGDNVRLVGWQSNESVRELLGRARAFVYAAEEDFGIAPVEAQAAGCPVIAFGRGGVEEIIQDGRTGILFPEQTTESLADAVLRFEESPARFHVPDLQANALRFSRERFQSEFKAYVEEKWASFNGGQEQA